MPLEIGYRLFASYLNFIRPRIQKTWFGVARDMVLETEEPSKQDKIEDERKGYKFDEVADIRSLLDQFMNSNSQDRTMACFKNKTSPPNEILREEFPDSTEVISFFRTRFQDGQNQPGETPQQQDMNAIAVIPQDDQAAIDAYNAINQQMQMQQPNYQQNYQQSYQQYQQNAFRQVQDPSMQQHRLYGKKVGEDFVDSQGHDYRAQISPKPNYKKTLLQELADNVKRKEGKQESKPVQQNRMKPRKYYDSDEYP